MYYDHEHDTADGERQVCDEQDLEAGGFTIYDSQQDELDVLFDGGPDLETPEGVAAAIRAIEQETEARAA
jgi:hypothetical protein